MLLSENWKYQICFLYVLIDVCFHIQHINCNSCNGVTKLSDKHANDSCVCNEYMFGMWHRKLLDNESRELMVDNKNEQQPTNCYNHHIWHRTVHIAHCTLHIAQCSGVKSMRMSSIPQMVGIVTTILVVTQYNANVTQFNANVTPSTFALRDITPFAFIVLSCVALYCLSIQCWPYECWPSLHWRHSIVTDEC